MTPSRPSPLGAALRGLGAGVLGSAAMTGWQELAARLRSSEGSGEEDGGEEQSADRWDDAPVPAKVARLIGQRVFNVDVPAERIPLLTNVMHWSYGTAWGAVYGIATRSTGRAGALRSGALFGSAVWVMSYVQLVPLGLYSPPWEYPPEELAFDLSYHLAYGAGTGLGYALVERVTG